MKMYFDDPLIDGQFVRTLNHVYHQGADVGECMATAARIKKNDIESWHREWTAIAERFYQQGEKSASDGHRVSAKESYLKACNYFRASFIFLYNVATLAQLKEAYIKHRDAFGKAIQFFDTPVELVEIPYENTTLKGYFMSADGTNKPRPTVILNGGYDSCSEESYFFSGAAAVARGYNCLLFDGPGQGGALIVEGVPSRYDWEHVVTPVVNYLLTRKDVEQNRIALMGISFGGYLAPRAASAEHRIAALIADPAQLDIFDAMKQRMPKFILDGLMGKSGLKKSIANMVMKKVLKHPTKGWALRRGLYVHGVATVKDYIDTIEQYSIKQGIKLISCHTLVCDAESDDISMFAKMVYDLLDCPKSYIKFKDSEGAGEHCEDGNRSLFNQRVFDWLDETFVTMR